MSGPGPASAQLPRPGDMIAGKYVLDRLLGQGGMGAVFAARHVKLSKNVAIKIMLADASNPEAAQRFINEGRAAANIQNEHVVRVDDVDEEMGYAYMVLELLEGEDLSQIIDKEPTRRLAPHVVVDFVLQALKGVSQAHAIGIVHRDLKPSNLFLAKRKDGSTVVKVLDFGISKAQGSSALAASPSALTSTKAMLGSPLYMSPEQLRSSKSVDQRADIWAVGIILYELITGSLPFMGETLGELFAAILETDPTPPSARVQGVPPGLDEVVMRCLQRRPDNRFQTAAELADALVPFTTAQPGYRASAPSNNALGGTAMLPPTAAASANMARLGAVTPAAQSISGSGPVSGFGMTPNPIIGGTTGGWQSTGGAAPGVPAGKPPFVALAVGGVAMVAFVTVLALFVPKMLSKSRTEPSATSAASAPPSPVSVPPTAASVVEAKAPVETAAPSASASAAVATPTSAHSPTKKVATTTVKPEPKPEPPKPVDPPKPATTAKPAKGVVNAEAER